MCKIGNHCKPSRAAMDVKNAKKRENRAKKNNIYNTLKEKGMEKEAMAVRAMTPSAAKVYLEKKNIKVEGVEELPIRNDQKSELKAKEEKVSKKTSETKKTEGKKTEKSEAKAKAPVKKESKSAAKKEIAKAQKPADQKAPAAKTQKKAQDSSAPTKQGALFDMNQTTAEVKETPKVESVTKPAEVKEQKVAPKATEEKKVVTEPKVTKPAPAASAPVVEPKPAPKPVVSDDWDDEDDDDRDYSRYEEGFGSTYDSYGYDDEDEDDDPELKALLDGFDDVEDESADFSDDDFR